jgi:CRP-like cAMP-binding protein
MDSLKDFTDQFKEVPQESVELILKLSSEKEFIKNEVITKIGEVPTNIYILKSGVARSFYTDENGKQYIRTLFTANKTAGSLASLLSGKPSKYTYDCLTDCILYKINFKEFIKLTKTNISLSNLYSRILENIFFVMERRIYNLSVLNATERYLNLKQEIPDIENIIPQYHIASYLNISAVQLSRIRKEIYTK